MQSVALIDSGDTQERRGETGAFGVATELAKIANKVEVLCHGRIGLRATEWMIAARVDLYGQSKNQRGRSMRWHFLGTTGMVVAAVTPLAMYSTACEAQLAAGTSVPAGNGAGAQPTSTSAPSQAPDQANAGQDVVVTAQRREERLYDVPITVRVTSGKDIDQKNYASVRDVIENSPQVSFQQTGDERTDTLSIRGLSSVSNAAGVEPDAAIVIDGETLARTMQMNQESLDVDHVEVLEGPQGTLFGKNAVAGLINIVSRGPTLGVFSGRVSAAIAEDHEYRLKGSINIPLGDHLAAYFTGYRSHMGGWEDNVHEGQPNAGASRGWGLRGQLLWQPDDTLKVMVRGEITQKTTGIIPYAFKSLAASDVYKAATSIAGTNAAKQQAAAQQIFGLLENSGIYLSGRGGQDILNGTKSYLYDDRTWGVMRNRAFGLNIDKDFGAGTLHALTTYRFFKLYSNDNEWGVSAPQLTNSPYGLDAYDYSGPSREKTIQQEIRFESDPQSKLNYVVGAFYYYNENYHREFTTECKDAVYGAYNGAGYPNPNPVSPVDNFQCTGGYHKGYTIQDFDSEVTTNNEAIFGNAEYNVTKKASVFAGARLLWEQQHMTLVHYADDSGAKAFDPVNPYGRHSADDSRQAFIYKVGAKYDFGPVLVYGTYSTGFKGVSWDNYDRAKVARALAPLAPERPYQVEVGMHGRLSHGLLDWSVSAFHLLNQHFQVRTALRDPSYQLAVVDAGRVLSEGIEGTVNVRPIRGVGFGGSYNWLPTAKILDKVEFANKTSFINYQGTRLPNAPKNSASAYAQYQFGFPAPQLTSTVRLDFRYRGRQQSVLTLDSLQVVQPYGIFDLYYTLAPRNEKWSVTLYAKNLTDHLYYQRTYEPAAVAFSYGQMGYLPRDYTRYVGGSFNYKF